MTTASFLSAIACGVLTAGCIGQGPFETGVGEPLAERCVNQDSDFGEDVSFEQHVLPIFKGMSMVAGRTGCGCHQPASPNPIGFEQTGLSLASLAGALAGGVNSQGNSVVPGSPCESILFQKISPAVPFGSRMPLSGPPFLNDEARRLISDWIAEGARDN